MAYNQTEVVWDGWHRRWIVLVNGQDIGRWYIYRSVAEFEAQRIRRREVSS